MKRAAIIRIVSLQKTENGNNNGEMTVVGTVDYENEIAVINYTENNEETGAEDTTITVYENNSVSIVRKGQFSSEMTVEKGARHHTFYRTPYGELTMGIYGNRVDWTRDDRSAMLRLRYTLDFNNGFVSENTMKIYIDEK